MDQWVQKLSLAVLLVAVSLCLYGAANREIACHTPAYFTKDHTRHAQLVCSKPDAFTVNVGDNPLTEFENLTLWTSHVETKSAWLLKLVLVEVIVACTVYCLIHCLVAAGRFDARTCHNELHVSYLKVPVYFVIQIVCCICWVIFAILSYQENEFPTDQSIFLCGYGVTQMGNTHSQTLQCVEDRDHFTRAAYMINFGLALVVTVTKLIHLVSALIIGPLLRLKAARAVLMKSGVIQKPCQLGVGFILSDLCFAMVTGEKDYGSLQQRSHVESDGAEAGSGKHIELSQLLGSQ